MANHRQAALAFTALAPALLTLNAMPGCAASSASGPAAARPAGPTDDAWTRPGRPASELPPPVRLVDDKSEGWHTVEPVVMDTRDFPVQLQVVEPWGGPVGANKAHLPAHSRDKGLPTLETQAQPVGVTGGDARATPTGVGFESIQQTPWGPPDPTLAVGPNHVIETVNQSIAFYTKDGTETFSAPLGSPGSPGFFEGQGAGNFTFDPKCFYDHKSGRFVVTVLETYGETEAYIDIAVSDDSDPNGVWYKYRTQAVIEFPNGTTYWVDYPGFGFDNQAFYVTGNLFRLAGNGNGFGGPVIRIFDKAPLLNGEPARFFDLRANQDGSMQAAQMHGDATIPYFVTRSASNAIRLWTVLDPITTPGLGWTQVTGLASASGPSNGAPNLGGGTLDTLDGRLMNAHWRDGNLYTAHAVNAPDNTTQVRWYHINTNGWPFGDDPALVQQGNIDLPGVHYFYPAIASDKFGRVGMVMARSSGSERASIYATGRVPSDPLGQMSDPVQLAIGTNGSSGRWGDYFDIALDPNDDRTFWVVGQYANNFGWQTWIGSFLSGCPGDENGDGQVNFFDIADFIGRFTRGDPSVDLSPPFGVIDFFDVVIYLDRFNRGCP